MTVLEAPAGICFSGNLPKLRLSAGEPVEIILTDSDSVILLDEYYIPDENGNIGIDFRGIVTESLNLLFPNTDVFVQSNITDTFNISIIESISLTETSVSFKAIRGGIKTLSITPELWLQANFLTWQEQEKQVEWDQPEWLSYYAQQDCELRITAYFEDGLQTKQAFAQLQAGSVYSIDVCFAKVATFEQTFSDKQMTYFDAAIWVSNTQLTYTQRYLLKNSKANSRTYMFENSLGGIDSATFNGTFSRTPEYEEQFALFDNVEMSYNVEKKGKNVQHTGFISRQAADWLQDMFGSLKKYAVDSGAMQQIIVESVTVKVDSNKDLIAFEFAFHPAEHNKFLSVERNYDDLPVPLHLVTPAGQLTELAPRLIEFPEIEMNADMLFPVQSPFEQKWYRISYQKLLEEILKNIAAVQELTWNNL